MLNQTKDYNMKFTTMTAAVVLATATTAMAGSTTHVTHDGTNYGTGNNGNFVALPSPTNGVDGADGKRGKRGAKGAKGDKGDRGAKGAKGVKGDKGNKGAKGNAGLDGRDAVASLGALSLTAATSSFYGNGIGFGLSASNYSGLEGSVGLGTYLGDGGRLVIGITTDFNDRHAASVGAGFSF